MRERAIERAIEFEAKAESRAPVPEARQAETTNEVIETLAALAAEGVENE